MSIDIQIKLKNNPNYIKYIRENSNWYKILNRDPNMFKVFEDEVKEKYKLRTTDKIGRALDALELIQNVVSTLHN